MALRRFWRSEAGNFAIMFAIALPALIGVVGLALDFGTMVKARTKLQSALDAAVLAASRIADDDAQREDTFHRYLRVNLANAPDLGAIDAGIAFDRGLNYIHSRGTATADMNLHFAFLWGDKRRVSAAAEAYEATRDIEVALVLDNTGSMYSNNRIGALRNAAKALLDILEQSKSPERSVSAALVPFVTAVNIRNDDFDMAWIDRHARNSLHGVNFVLNPDGSRQNHLDLFAALGVQWKGCVEARPAPYNLDDTPPDPSRPETLFVPYFAPDEPGESKEPGDDAGRFNNSYLADGDLKDQDHWEILRSTARYFGADTSGIEETPPMTNGPNRACPTPIVPLTEDFDTLRTAVAGMWEWNGSGTNVSEGLAWGWRVLSPGQPFTQGLPFNSEHVSKFVVLLSDGTNEVYGASREVTGSDYGSYGFLASGRFGTTSRSAAIGQVDDWTLDICDELKSRDVEIFTVLLQADTAANRRLYSSCASSDENYFPTNDVSALEDVFRKIASRIATLYVSG